MVAEVSPQTYPRYRGLDFARCIAVLGMVLVNFTYMMDEGDSPDWLLFLIGCVQGRAAAIFVVLAGAGISLLSSRARNERSVELFREVRRVLLKRAVFLLVLGISLISVWPADILHFYALYIAFAVLMLSASSRVLWASALASMVAFVIMFFLFDYDAAWTTEGEYRGFWTVAGTMQRMFFNGYYPFFPWTAFLLVGMWLGRQNLGGRKRLNQLLWISAVVAILAQVLSWYLTGLSEFVDIEEAQSDMTFWSTDPFPPGPLYIISSTGIAFVVILLSQKLTLAFSTTFLTRIFVVTGQMALSVYVAHAVIGMPILKSLGIILEESAGLASTVALGFCLASMLFAMLWRRKFERGPLEVVMRRLIGSA